MRPVNLYLGWDARESVGLLVFIQSLLELSTVPVRITPLYSNVMETREGSNTFTWARFAVPRLMGWTGTAIFMDGSDMLMRCDIAELLDLADPYLPVQCVKHRYKTQHPVKYVGTELECPNVDYDRKQWASLFVANCHHQEWRRVTDSLDTLQMRFVDDGKIGELDPSWNWLCQEQGENHDAKILHFTAGIPAIDAYRDSPHADEWLACRDRAFASPKAKEALARAA